MGKFNNIIRRMFTMTTFHIIHENEARIRQGTHFYSKSNIIMAVYVFCYILLSEMSSQYFLYSYNIHLGKLLEGSTVSRFLFVILRNTKRIPNAIYFVAQVVLWHICCHFEQHFTKKYSSFVRSDQIYDHTWAALNRPKMKMLI